MNFDLDIPSVLITIGAVFFVLWVAALLGLWKKWYWRSQNGMVYGYIGVAIAALASGFQTQLLVILNGHQWILDGLVIGGLVITLLIAFFSPAFLKPKWIRQIEREPKYVYREMAEQVKDGFNWHEKLVDYDTLESWIKEIKRKPQKKAKSGK
jgi:hypothetical protein